MTAIDHYGELDGRGTTEVGEGVEGGPGGATGEEYVVDQDHVSTGDVDGNDRPLGSYVTADSKVVPIVAHVEFAGGDGPPLEGLDYPAEPAGELDASGMDTDQDYSVGTTMGFEDLMGDATQNPFDVLGGHHLGHGTAGLFGAHPIRFSFPASQDRP